MDDVASVVIDQSRRSVTVVAAPIGLRQIFWAIIDGELSVGSHPQRLGCLAGRTPAIRPEALFQYLYFHMLPGPASIFEGIAKLEGGHCIHWDGHAAQVDRYWRPTFDEVAQLSEAEAKAQLHDLLRSAIARELNRAPKAGAFLSGGLDSSTVAGIAAGIRPGIPTVSMGFDARGYDEMEYARCAADRYKCNSHEYYLKPADIVTAIPVIAREYDEPFGNASAVPTYFCARTARESGFERMFAGDGGDEIFGGNARYAKQRLFEAYAHLPALLRHGLIEPIAHLPGLSNHFPLAKLKSYITQAKVGLPLRLESYNFLHRTPLDQIFAADFINAVDPSSADAALTEVYGRTASDHYINRMMHLDLKFTLADNDLRKVGTMTEAAGIEVRYPLLDDRMVAFAHHLPVDYKVRGQKLRWFFKEALSDLLPEKIINKSKHGFGLPFGVWSMQYAPLGELVGDSLSDFKKRGWIQPAYLDHMQAMQRGQHASYYGVMIWVTMMLERWLQENGH